MVPCSQFVPIRRQSRVDQTLISAAQDNPVKEQHLILTPKMLF